MYSVDYPFATNDDGLEFMTELQSSDLVSTEELTMIAHKNAERVLGFQLPKTET